MSQDLITQALEGQSIITLSDAAILAQSKFKGFAPAEMAYCLKIAATLRLNPIANQIHFVKRKSRDGSSTITAQVGIDGLRLIAQRAGGYAGSEDAVFEYDGPNQKRPSKATVVVYKMIDKQRCAFSASARWEEYFPGAQGLWEKMPHNQLAKCAEALALRKAFPAELSNVYAEEEMDQDRAPSKAQDIEAKVKGEPIEVESEVVEQEQEAPEAKAANDCPLCGAPSEKIIISKRDPNFKYCFGCKQTFPVKGAA